MMADESNLVSTKERPGIYDGLESAKSGEPVFVVQGGDQSGPPTVLFWVKDARARAFDEPDSVKATKLLRKATAAEEVAWAMQAYQRGEVEITGRRATYYDHADMADEVQSERATLIRASEQLHDALARATVIAENLAKARLAPEQEIKVREAIDLLRQAAFEIEPRRGNERS